MATVHDLVPTLSAALGDAGVLTKPEDIIPYGFDGTAALRDRPGVVVLPTTTAQVAACVKAAHHAGVPIVTRGSGTGLSGGSVPTPETVRPG